MTWSRRSVRDAGLDLTYSDGCPSKISSPSPWFDPWDNLPDHTRNEIFREPQ